MSDRLQELRRQRALVQEQLAWLDREIAQCTETSASLPASAPPATPFFPAPSVAASSPVPPVLDAILEKYRVPPAELRQDVRKGCLLYFSAALMLFAAAVIGLYLLLRHS